MSTTNTVDIERVPRTYEFTDIGVVKNPMKKDFVHLYDGKPITIKAGKEITKALPIAVLMAEHLARYIIAEKHEAELKKVRASDMDEKLKENIIIAGIPEYDKKIKEQVDKLLTVESEEIEEEIEE